MRNQDPPGRFLKWDEKKNQWNKLDDKEAVEKIKQALRDKKRHIKTTVRKIEHVDYGSMCPSLLKMGIDEECVNGLGSVSFYEFVKEIDDDSNFGCEKKTETGSFGNSRSYIIAAKKRKLNDEEIEENRVQDDFDHGEMRDQLKQKKQMNTNVSCVVVNQNDKSMANISAITMKTLEHWNLSNQTLPSFRIENHNNNSKSSLVLDCSMSSMSFTVPSDCDLNVNSDDLPIVWQKINDDQNHDSLLSMSILGTLSHFS